MPDSVNLRRESLVLEGFPMKHYSLITVLALFGSVQASALIRSGGPGTTGTHIATHGERCNPPKSAILVQKRRIYDDSQLTPEQLKDQNYLDGITNVYFVYCRNRNHPETCVDFNSVHLIKAQTAPFWWRLKFWNKLGERTGKDYPHTWSAVINDDYIVVDHASNAEFVINNALKELE